MFTSFIRPARRELAAGFILLALFLFLGRFLVGDGSVWNSLVCGGTAVIFAVLSTRLRAARSLDVPLRTWFTGLLATATLWSVLLGVLGTATATLNQHLSPYYVGYDSFLITSGPVTDIDTNGAAYVLADRGMSITTVLLTFLIYFLAFLCSAAIGAMVGMIRIRGNVILAVLAIAVVVVGLMAFSIWVASWDSPEFPVGPGHPEAFLWAGVPTVLLAFALTWWTARKVEV